MNSLKHTWAAHVVGGLIGAGAAYAFRDATNGIAQGLGMAHEITKSIPSDTLLGTVQGLTALAISWKGYTWSRDGMIHQAANPERFDQVQDLYDAVRKQNENKPGLQA